MDASLAVLERMCAAVGAKIASVERHRVSRMPRVFAAEVRVHLEAPATSPRSRLVKVAFVGASGGGKSTVVGVLSGGALDNGSGSARLSLLRHRHEVLSGRTSSMAVEFLPFDAATAQPIRHDYNYDSIEPVPLAHQRQLLGAGRVVQLVDLAGDPRYQKTTYAALTSWAAPDWICVVVPATAAADDESTRDILALVLGLHLPFFLLITKTDLVEDAAVLRLAAELPGAIDRLAKDIGGGAAQRRGVHSVLRVSCVGGDGVDNLTAHTFRLYPRRNIRLMNHLLARIPRADALFCIEGVQSVPDVGTVLSGTVVHGAFALDAQIAARVGPMANGVFAPIAITSTHRMRLPVRSVSAGQMVTLAVAGVPEDSIHRGMLVAVAAGGDGGQGEIAADDETVALPLTGRVEADVTGGPSSGLAGSEPVQGVLYWMGARWSAHLTALQPYYGGAGLRASFSLIDARASPLPGTRLIFVSPHMRMQGLVHAPTTDRPE